jgi:hypothetical protein
MKTGNLNVSKERVLYLYPSRIKWVLTFLASMAFVAAGVFIFRHSRSARDEILAALTMCFFGLGMILSVLQLVPGSSYLRLDPEGILIRACWRQRKFRWGDLGDFGVFRPNRLLPFQRLVGFRFSEAYVGSKVEEKLRKVNLSICKWEGSLPENYGYSTEKLASLIKEFRDEYGST